MLRYKYFGNAQLEADDVVFRKFGQELPVAPAIVLDILRHRGGILPSVVFDEIFTKEQIGDRRVRVPSNQDFMARHRRALDAQQAHLKEIENNVDQYLAQSS